MQSSSTTAAGSTGTSLWRRLCALQPTLSIDTAKLVLPTPPPSQHRTPMSYSFVVVPPPVPAATPNFEAHVASLLSQVPHPVFITCTSYSPYFTNPKAEQQAMQSAATREEDVSATQRALTFLHSKLPSDAGLVLTITGTRTTTDDDAQRQPSTLIGASKEGIRAVLRDFTHRVSPPMISTPATPSSTRVREGRSGGLMVLRGDDGGYTRSGVSANDASPPSPNPYSTFADGAALVRFVSDEQRQSSNNTGSGSGGETQEASVAPQDKALCLLTGGYAQGHVLDRVWGTNAEQVVDECGKGGKENDTEQTKSPRSTMAAAATAVNRQTSPSLEFLDWMEKSYTDTEAQLRHAQGSHQSPRPITVESCRETVDALLTRLHAVRQLWQTPSCYSADARADCMRQLLAEKVLLRGAEGQCVDQPSGEGARVVVTQMLTSAQEFTQFTEDARRGLVEALKSPHPAVQDAAVVLVPGLMAPLRAEQFLRVTLQLKVIPADAMRRALGDYEEALKAAGAQLETGDAAAAVETFRQAKEKAEVRFEDAMVDFTVALAEELHAGGYTHVNFSAFQYGCGEAIGRVAARLPR